MSDRPSVQVKHRDRHYAERYETKIWKEHAASDNPFVVEKTECFGYQLDDLVESVSYVDMVYLLVRGELPSKISHRFLNKLMVAYANLGVRHTASRAAVLGGVGKTLASQVLPIGLLTYGGRQQGVGQIDRIMKFLSFAVDQEPSEADEELQHCSFELAGYVLGERDRYAEKIADSLINEPLPTPHLEWCFNYLDFLRNEHSEIGWLKSTVIAAAFNDLMIPAKYGVGLAQMISAPGLVAQGFEHAGEPTTVLPFVDDDAYEIKK